MRIDRAWREDAVCHITVTTTQRAARCPLCQRRSKRVHSHYQRVIGDLPCGGSPVVLHLRARRFVCRVPWCRRRIFTERLSAVVAPSARRTTRLLAHLLRDGFDLGGAPGARHATAEGMPVSRRTLLRLVRAAPTPAAGTVRVVGIDDWANKRGRTYGTIVVNLETHRVIDVLPDRTAATVAAWLAGHPEIEVVSRDRAGAYAEAARQGAPQAIQIADRFHLLKNVTEAFERYLARKHAALRQAAEAPSLPAGAPAAAEAVPPEDLLVASGPPAAAPPQKPRNPKAQIAQERRARRVARYEEVLALHATGASMRAIARATRLNKRTIMRFIHAEGFPEQQPRARHARLLTPFLDYLRARWDAGCHNAKQLWQEIRAQGYPGGRTVVAAYLQSWRARPEAAGRVSVTTPASPTPMAVSCAPRQVCWLLLRPPEKLTDDEQAYLRRVYHGCPEVAVVQALAKEFATVLREHDVAGWYAWLHGVELSGIADLTGVARSMRQDRQAIEAAITLDWSNGVVEGKVNKLKVTKRVMFGRANFDLLRRRVLHAA